MSNTKEYGTNERLIKALKEKNDEFYTIYELFEILTLRFLLDKLKDKIIYCPCDAEWSNIVKVLKDYKDLLQYKELIYTSDDFRNHDNEFEYCDVVITNPPFSLSKLFYEMLKKHNCLYFVYCSMLDISKEYMKYDIISGKTKYIDMQIELEPFRYEPAKNRIKGNHNKHSENDLCLAYLFYCPDDFYRRVRAVIYTNLPGIENRSSKDVLLTKTLADVEEKFGYLDNTKILNIKNWRNFPKDYYGIAAISPFKYSVFYDKFEIVCCDKKIINPLLKINGKNIFERWFVRQIGSDAKLEDYIQNDKINKLF